MSKVIILIGSVFFCYGLVLGVMSNLNVGVILTIFIGVAAILCGIFYKRIKEKTSTGLLKYLKNFLVISLLIEIVFVGFIAIYGQNDNITYKEDAVIVLGAGIRGENVTLTLKMRLDKAIEYHQKNPNAIIVVTGGQGFQETVTEAYAMEKYLIDNGVSASHIIKEEKATSTNENMRFSKEILDKHFGNEYSAVIITNNFHIYRGVSIAEKEGITNTTHMHAGLQWYNLIPCYLRESLAILKMWTVG